MRWFYVLLVLAQYAPNATKLDINVKVPLGIFIFTSFIFFTYIENGYFHGNSKS